MNRNLIWLGGLVPDASKISPFRETAYTDLIVCRIILLSFTVWCLVFLVKHELSLVLELSADLYDPIFLTKLLFSPFGWGAYPPQWIVSAIYWLTVAASIFALLGFRTNTSLLVCAAGMALVQSYIYSFGDMHHREAVLVIVLVAFGLSPCGRHFSIDSAVGFGSNRVLDSPDSSGKTTQFAYWPIFLAKAFLSLMYLSAVVSKLNQSGLDWANGFTLQSIMVQDGIRWSSSLALWMSTQHELLWFGQHVVLLFQAFFWLVIFYPRLGWVLYPMGICFHTLILIAMKAPFYHWIMLYLLFVPYSNIIQIYNRKRRAKTLFDYP